MDEIDRLAGVESPVDEEQLERTLEEAIAGDPKPWKVSDLREADYWMRKLQDLRERRQRYLDEASLWTRPADKLARAIAWAENVLKEWGRANRTSTEKSWELPRGTISTKPVRDTIEIEDMEAVVAWALTHHAALVHTKESVLVSELKEHIKTADRVTGLQLTSRATGDVSVLNVEERTEEEIATLIADYSDEYVIEAVYRTFVLDSDGEPIPGVAYVPGYVSVSVKPSGL